MLGQQVGINQVSFSSSGGAFAIDHLGVDGIEGNPSFQQGRDQQTVFGFDDAGDLIERGYVSQEADQLGTHLELPSWLEPYREELDQVLPALRLPAAEAGKPS